MKIIKLVQSGRVLAAAAIALTAVPTLAASNGLCGPSGCTLLFNNSVGVGQSQLSYAPNVGDPTKAVWLMEDDLISELGGDGWQPVVGDFNDDGHDDLAVYKDGVYIVDWNVSNTFGVTSTTYTLPTGAQWSANTIPVLGDWDGVGGDDFGIYTDGVFTLFPDKADFTDTITIDFGGLPQIPGYAFTQMPISGPIDNDPAGIARVGIYFGNIVKYAPTTDNAYYNFYDMEDTAAVTAIVSRPLAFSRPVIVDIDVGPGTAYRFSFMMPPGFATPDAGICDGGKFICGALHPRAPQTQRPIIIPPDPFN